MARTIKIDYSQFKSAGVYTLEFDATESINLTTQTTRLIVGFSRRGPINAPVFLRSKKDARDIFGDIDFFLERRGSFFHRSLFTALDLGPVFALNLMPLNNDPDVGDFVPYTSFSLATTEENGQPVRRLYSSFFNTERFWKLDQRNLLANVNWPGSPNQGKLLNFVNVGQQAVSILVRKASSNGLPQFNVPAREFFGAGNVPSYVNEYDYISDYFVEVFFVQGKFDDLRALSTDPVFSEFFDLSGLKKDKMVEFLGSTEVSVIGQFVGSVIPDLVDGNGIVHSIDTLINNQVAVTGVFCALDRTALGNYDPETANAEDNDGMSAVDMVGHNFAKEDRQNPEIINFLGYRTTVKESITFPISTQEETFQVFPEVGGLQLNPSQGLIVKGRKLGKEYGFLNNMIGFVKPDESSTVFTVDEWLELYALLIPGQSLIQLESSKWGVVQSKQVVNETVNGVQTDVLYITYTNPEKAKETLFRPLPFTISLPTPDTRALFSSGVLDFPTVAKAASTGNVDIQDTLLSLDGISLSVGDIVLLKNQTDARENGLYVVGATDLTRHSSLDQNSEAAFSIAIDVATGSGSNSGKTFALTTQDAVIDVTDLNFVQYIRPMITFSKTLAPNVHKTPVDNFANPSWWLKAGEELLVENRTRRVSFYLPIKKDVVISPSEAKYELTIDAIPALERLFDLTTFGFGAYVHSSDSVKGTRTVSNIQIALRPNLTKWVSPRGTRGGVTLNSFVTTLGSQSFKLRIAQGVGTVPTHFNDIIFTESEFMTDSYFPGVVSSTSTGTVRLEHKTTGRVVYVQLRAAVSAATVVSTNVEREFFITNSQTFRDAALGTVASDWVVTWQFTEQPHFLAYRYSKLHDYFLKGVMLPGDRFFYTRKNAYFLNYERTSDANGVPVLKVTGHDVFNTTTLNFANVPNRGVSSGQFMNLDNHWLRDGLTPIDVFDADSGGITIYGNADSFYDSYDILSTDSTKTKFTTSLGNAAFIQVGHYVTGETLNQDGTLVQSLTRVIGKRRTNEGNFEFTTTTPVKVFTNGTLLSVTRYIPLDDFATSYQMTSLDGFKLTDYHLPGGSQKLAQMEKIYGMLDPSNSNLRATLAESQEVVFRYVVDTFDGAIAPQTGPKVHLARLAKARQKCLALLNMPSIQEFIESTDPRFTDEPTRTNPVPALRTDYMVTGGNLSLGPSSTFTLVDEQNGSKYAGYFGPYLVLRENGRNIVVPPAAHVSNNFIQKFINGQPFSITAGTRRGVVSDPNLRGLEYEFLNSDRDNLEPFGINPIINKRGVGYVIYGNQMAYQKTPSAFNSLHVRDLLITIEDAIEQILANYVFEFNDTATRVEIKTLVDGYLDTVRAAGGIEDFFTIMDDSNNTPDIITRKIGIIDVAVVPAYGLEKIINRVTLLKPGGVQSSGFLNFV